MAADEGRTEDDESHTANGAVPSGDRQERPLSRQLRSISGQVAVWSTGARARLRRENPESPGASVSEVIALLRGADVPDRLWETNERLQRWARVCHLVGTLAGASGRATHAPVWDKVEGQDNPVRHFGREAGRAIHDTRYSELRLMRLTSARGPALADQVRRLARYLAAAGTLPIDLTPVAELLLFDGEDEDRLNRARLDIARAYYKAAQDKVAQDAKGATAGTKGKP